ncbi:head-tail connector protein [Pseudomonas aeruginosa]|uniref:head-tail connector protein n=1 Tax=Pseudomonas aeruginosa TaxID=287 RepID=UPI0024A9B101|nr:head-tail connector protein [Pseudomonas aeruginosa]MDI3626911.1 head-tail connector protein [Pseudomonas aeruginosa]MDS1041584.1 head-tail connector protein [Pseudomonas aeruginosa]HBN8983673.1 phage gp6-like head-tail connector protein [Pseudomonas aeruginosa]HBO4225746.1 phage gp6-like head-tail connector protein [Pseudomonas aeruginosa]HDL5095466.1 phage gp6-like head-tail connector protein [Pseudomonas aeruginosa]
MSAVTLDDVKIHLRLDHDDEDSYLTALVEAAERHISVFLSDDLPDPMPAPVKAAVLLLVGDLYENRERMSDRDLSEVPTYAMLLAPYRSMRVL